MLAILKREVKGYFTSMMGYVFGAFLLFITGIYFTAYNLSSAYPYFGYALSSITFVFLIIVPLLTMRCLSEERKNKTDQLILTSPVSVGKMVWGKYLAMVFVFAVPILIMCAYPLVLHSMGNTSLLMAYTSILAFFLVGCVFIAIGMFISSLTESPVLAAVLTFVVLFADYMVSGLASFFSSAALGSFLGIVFMILAVGLVLYMMTKNVTVAISVTVVLELIAGAIYKLKPEVYAGSIQKVFNALDITVRMDDFINGVFNTSNLIYLVSVALLFVFLTVQSVQKRRWS